VEIGDDASGLEDLITAEEAEVLAAGGEIELHLHGPWQAKVVVRRCPRCRFELFPGNRFCVECGAPVDAARPTAGDP
jgi:hypothetical protein